jgi:hypothetical protein
MSAISDILTGLKTVMELTTKVGALTQDVDTLAAEVRNLDRRLVRVETIIEVTRPDGAVLRIAKKPGTGGQPTED